MLNYHLMRIEDSLLINISSHLTFSGAQEFLESDSFIYAGSKKELIELLFITSSTSFKDPLDSKTISIEDHEDSPQGVLL